MGDDDTSSGDGRRFTLTVNVTLPPTIVMFVKAGPSGEFRIGSRRRYGGTMLGFVETAPHKLQITIGLLCVQNTF